MERGFSMALSRFGDPRDGDCVLVVAGTPRPDAGAAQFVPWGDDGLSLDLMRGDRTADNGLTELMVVAVVEAAPALAVRRLSLNFAVLRSVFARAEELGAGPVLRLWHRLLMLGLPALADRVAVPGEREVPAAPGCPATCAFRPPATCPGSRSPH